MPSETLKTFCNGLQERFSATGLLAAALPQADLPDMGGPWTIDPALTLARRVEQALSELKDDDDAWTRLQRQIGEDLTELQRALSALGHQAHAEQSDWGLIYRVFDPNRTQALVVAFENVPVCTRTFRDSIRLAEHCHPETRAPMAGCWLEL